MQGPLRHAALAAFIAASLALSACGGGGGGTSPAPSAGGNSGSGAGTGSGGGTTSGARAPAKFSVSFLQYQPVKAGSARRAPAFISPYTQSIQIEVVSNNGIPIANPTPTTINLGPNVTGCTASGAQITCLANIDAPVGTDVFSVSSFPLQNGGGTPLGTTLAPASVVQNATNLIPLSINGTIANLLMFIESPPFVVGTPDKRQVVVVPLDASGAIIVNPGSYNPSITVTSSDHTGAFSLIFDGSPSGTTATIASPNDQIKLSYAGGTTNVSTNLTAAAGTVTATASTGALGAGVPPLAVVPAGANVVHPLTNFVFPGVTGTGSLTVTGGTPPYTVTSSDTSAVTVSGSGGSYTVTPVGYGTGGLGTATITVTDSTTPMPLVQTIPVSITAPALNVAVGTCGTAATCSTSGVVFPVAGLNNANPQSFVTLSLTGGTGSYSTYFASSGGAQSAYATTSQSGGSLTIQPTNAGNDTLVITSGSQTAIYSIVEGPTAFGIEEEGGAQGYGVPSTVASATILTGTSLIQPPTVSGNVITITPILNQYGTGTIALKDSGGTTIAVVPFTLFDLTFSTYAGTNIGAVAQEAFTGIGQTDTVTVLGAGGTLSATSGNTGIVTASASGSTVTVTSVGVGTTTVTLTDSATGASYAYPVSVTTTTIPVAGRARSR